MAAPERRRELERTMQGYNFTERVRRALANGREFAADLGHSYIGTEHMLLGILSDGESLGTVILERLGAERSRVADGVREIVRKGSGGQEAFRADLPYTSRAKKVLELSMQEARAMNHSYVGTEHLVLGLLAEGKGVAAQVLQSSGVTLDRARLEMLALLGGPDVATQTAKPSREEWMATAAAQLPPKGEKPTSVGLILRYSNGAVVTKSFASPAEAASFLSGQ
jgi:ATP-dependent Clp protease ATP-binding subunit ClpC